jgi:hypothetical protein
MHYTLRLTVEAWHRPTETWHVASSRHGLRAVSRKHAINKGLKVAQSWPAFQDRAEHADWNVTATAELLEAE